MVGGATDQVARVSKSAIVQQFRAVTGASGAEAQQCLREHNYWLEAAVDAYLGSGTHSPRLTAQQLKHATGALHAVFDIYRDPDGDADTITAEGALAMFEALGVDVASVAVLPLSYYLASPALGHFTRAGYTDGWLQLGLGPSLQDVAGADAVLALQRAVLPSLMATFEANGAVLPSRTAAPPKKGLYTSVYEYTFLFARADGQKNLPLDVAITFWDLLLPHAPSYDRDGSKAAAGLPSFSPAQVALWKRFLTEETQLQVVSKDTWTQFLEFTQEIDPRFAHYAFDSAWPSVIDEFVEWARGQVGSS